MSVLKLLMVVVGGASAQQLPVPSVPLELSGGNWVLELKLDPFSPRGTVRRDGQTFLLIKPRLVLRSTSATRAGVTAEYRLQFAIDTCANAKPTLPGEWPGPCAYPDGAAPPVRLQHHDVLITRRRLATGEAVSDQFTAACVPTSGEGPFCRLEGALPTITPTASR